MKLVFNLWLTILLLLFTIYYLPPTISAREASTSASPSASLIEKINSIKAEIASRAASFRLDVDKKIQNKAVAGVVKSISETELEIITKDGERTFLIDDFTAFESKSKKPATPAGGSSLTDIDNEDFIVGLGDLDDKNRLAAKKIIKLAFLPKDRAKFVWGQVKSVNNTTITLEGKDKQKILVTVIAQNSSYTSGNDEEASFSDIKVNKHIIAKGKFNDAKGENAPKVLQSDFIYIIP